MSMRDETADRRAHIGSRERLARRLDRRFARTPVLLVLSALSGVAALELSGIGAGESNLDDGVRTLRAKGFGAHHQDAAAGLRQWTVHKRIVVLLGGIIGNPDHNVR